MSAPTHPDPTVDERPAGADAAVAPACCWRPDRAVGAPPCWRATVPAAARLEYAFAILRRHGTAALLARAGDASTARRQVVEALAARWPAGSGWYALTTEADHLRCLDPAGGLRAPLPVHHHPGAARAVVAALAEAGLSVAERGDDRLTVAPGG